MDRGTKEPSQVRLLWVFVDLGYLITVDLRYTPFDEAPTFLSRCLRFEMIDKPDFNFIFLNIYWNKRPRSVQATMLTLDITPTESKMPFVGPDDTFYCNICEAYSRNFADWMGWVKPASVMHFFTSNTFNQAAKGQNDTIKSILGGKLPLCWLIAGGVKAYINDPFYNNSLISNEESRYQQSLCYTMFLIS